MKIYNIASNFKFLPSLARFVAENIDCNKKTLLILPNKRSCSEFKKVANLNHNNITKVTAISDLGLNDASFATGVSKFSTNTQNVFSDKASDIKYIYQIIQELRSIGIFSAYKNSALIPVAKSLKSLFDDIIKSQIELKDVDLDDYNLSSHRQFSINFLQSFYHNFTRIARKNKIITKSELLKNKIDRFTEIIDSNNCENCNIIIAGTTGSVDYVKNLIRSITAKNTGYLIFQGAQFRDYKNIQEGDPANLFLQLMEKNSYDRSQIKEINYDSFITGVDSQYHFVSNIFNDNYKDDISGKYSEKFKNVKLLNSDNEISQAENILKIIKSYPLSSRVAIISNDRGQSQILKSFFDKAKINYSDAQNNTLNDNGVIKICHAIFKIIDEDFSSHSVLNFLNIASVKNHIGCQNLLYFESNILRRYNKSSNLMQIVRSEKGDKTESIKNLLITIEKVSQQLNIMTLAEVFDNVLSILSDDLAINIASNFSAEDYEVFLDFMDCIKFFNSGKSAIGELTEVFLQIFGLFSLKKSSEPFNIEIVSTVESRLIDYDLVILATFNKGFFPKVESENWLSGKIRKEMGISSNEKLISLAAYDFCNIMSGSNIIVSYCNNLSGAPAQKSEFLLRLELMLKSSKVNLEQYFPPKELMDELPLLQNDDVKIDISNHIKNISATQVTQLIFNPYLFYAKKILKLNKSKDLDYAPGPLEFGIFIHDLLDLYVSSDAFDEDKDLLKCFYKYFHCNESKLIFLPRSRSSLKSFIKENSKLFFDNNLNEVSVKVDLSGFLISAKIDRVIINKEDSQIIDYKTGSLPSKKDVLLGRELQLPLYSYIASRDKSFTNNNEVNFSTLSYFKVGLKDSKLSKILSGEDMNRYLDEFFSNISQLFDYLANNKVSFIKTDNADHGNEFIHFLRNK